VVRVRDFGVSRRNNLVGGWGMGNTGDETVRERPKILVYIEFNLLMKCPHGDV
jgi:hypothetical protein